MSQSPCEATLTGPLAAPRSSRRKPFPPQPILTNMGFPVKASRTGDWRLQQAKAAPCRTAADSGSALRYLVALADLAGHAFRVIEAATNGSPLLARVSLNSPPRMRVW